MTHLTRGLIVMLVGWSVLASTPAYGGWVVTEIPMLPHWSGSVEIADINSAGVVCGVGNYVVNTSSTVFRYDGATVTELPHLAPSDPLSLCTGINGSGVICGYGHNALGKSQAVYWDGAVLHTMPYPPGANPDSDFRAYGLNDSGVIVGYFWNMAGRQTAFYFRDGVSYSLDAVLTAAGLSGPQFANAVNSANLVCGVADEASGITSVWTYAIDTGTLTVIGRIGSDDCSATDINEAGHTIGRGKQTSADINRAVSFDGAWHIVDSAVNVTQWGMGINDHGRMVGHAQTGSSRWSWYSDGSGSGSMVAINLPGWSRVTVQAINDSDWIVGQGWTTTSGGANRGFIVALPAGDADHDGDVDLADYAAFAACLSGPRESASFVAPTGACLQAFDATPSDGDVDLADFAVFQRALPTE